MPTASCATAAEADAGVALGDARNHKPNGRLAMVAIIGVFFKVGKQRRSVHF